MTTADRLWLWSQPVVAVLAGVAGVWAWVLQLSGQVSALPTLQALVTGSFVLPGLALSLLINHAAVMLRRPPRLTIGERLLLIIEYTVVVAILAISLSPDALILGYLLWPLLIAVAAMAFYSMAANTIRSRRPSTGGEHDDLAAFHDSAVSG
jgi:hypothetical protein